MRALIIFVLFLTVVTANAQLSLSAKGGWNNSTAALIKYGNQFGYPARPGWQAGLQAQYAFNSWLLYSGLAIDKRNLFNSYNNYKGAGVYYKPTFLTLPLGLGYSYSLTKNFGLRVYSGLYISKGIGGRYTAKQPLFITGPVFWCDPGPCPETFAVVDRKIRFGNNGTNSPQDDLAAFNWGAQFGLGIAAWKQWELVWMYNLGLSNMLPGTQYDDHRIRSVSLDLKVNLKTFKTTAKHK